MPDRPPTEQQMMLLRRACRNGRAEVHGRGGPAKAKGLAQRGLVTKHWEVVGTYPTLHTVDYLVPTAAGRKYLAEHDLG